MKCHFIYSPPMIVENMFLLIPRRSVQVPCNYSTTSRGRCQNIVYKQLVNRNGTLKRLSKVLPSVGFQATSILDELCTLDVFPQRRLTHSLKPPCSMRNTLNTATNTELQNRKYLWKAFFFFNFEKKSTLTISSGNHNMCVLPVQRQ